MWHELWADGILELHRADSPYAYVIACCAGVCQLIALGSINTFSLFFSQLANQFHAGLASLSLVVSVANFLAPVIGPFAGGMATRYGTRWVIVTAAVCQGASYLATSFTTQFWHIFLTYGLLAGISAGCTISPSLAIVGEWFEKRRALGMGIAFAGSGLGTIVLPVFASAMLAQYTNDWRSVFRWMAALSGVMLVAAALLRQRLYVLKSIQSDSISRLDLIMSGSFVTLFLVGMFFSYTFFIPLVHLVSYAEAQGVSTTWSARALSVLGLFTSVGNISWGWLADRTSYVTVFRVCHFCAGTTMCLWPLVGHDQYTIMVIAAVIGCFNGGCVTCYPALAAWTFPPEKLSAGISLMYTGFGIGSLLGPVATGWIVDRYGSYTIALLVGGGAMYAALIAAMFFKKDKPKSFTRTASGQVLQFPPDDDYDYFGGFDTASDDEGDDSKLLRPIEVATVTYGTTKGSTGSFPSPGNSSVEQGDVGSGK
eukprot:TRINITY_DN57664_c0_g1_i2.p1 TRINITY_DN57664_c0_g1~~TRINITY_DN57664_c0_g1_i2.p1  ORF type:complete len:482 (+),score=21.68 TRINITY_DN57664_c0_g1_i2:73-1518(+)